jgi:hypothetical protein
MHLTPLEVAQFYRIWMPLLHWLNEERRVVARFPMPSDVHPVSPELLHPVRTLLWSDPTILDAFIDENPAKLSDADLDLASTWRTRLTGKFFILKHLKRSTIFLAGDEEDVAYEVIGISSPLSEVFPYPTMVEATLLPFGDRIIYDSIIHAFPVTFGKGMRGGLNRSYANAKANGRLHRTLPQRISAVLSPLTRARQASVSRKHNPRIAERLPGNTSGWAIEFDELDAESKKNWKTVREGTKRR